MELRVVVSPEILQVQRGQTYELTCGVYGADAGTTIYWIQEEPERVTRARKISQSSHEVSIEFSATL